MAELIQLRRSLREEAKSLNYSDEETNKFITEQLALHAANEETRRQEEEKRRSFELTLAEQRKLEAEARRLDSLEEDKKRKHELAIENKRALDREKEREKELEIENRRALDREKEREEREKEREDREKERQTQIRLAEIAAGIQPSDNNDPSRSPSSFSSTTPNNPLSRHASVWTDIYDPRLEAFDVYLRRFSDCMELNNIPPEMYCRILISTLRGEDYDTYCKLTPEDKESFTALKNALLNRHQLHASHYQKKFRSSTLRPGENYTQFAERIRSYLLKWIELGNFEQSFDGLINLLMTEQVESQMPSKLKAFLIQQGIEGLLFSLQAADRFLQANKIESTHSRDKIQSHPTHPRNQSRSGRPFSQGHRQGTPQPSRNHGTCYQARPPPRLSPPVHAPTHPSPNQKTQHTAHQESQRDSRPSQPGRPAQPPETSPRNHNGPPPFQRQSYEDTNRHPYLNVCLFRVNCPAEATPSPATHEHTRVVPHSNHLNADDGNEYPSPSTPEHNGSDIYDVFHTPRADNCDTYGR